MVAILVLGLVVLFAFQHNMAIYEAYAAHSEGVRVLNTAGRRVNATSETCM